MSVFVSSKKAFEFVNPESGEAVKIPRGYLGEVPDWAPKLWLFQAAVKDAAITYVGQSQPETAKRREKPADGKTE